LRSNLIDGFGAIVAAKNAHILKKVMFATVEAFLRGALFRKESRAPIEPPAQDRIPSPGRCQVAQAYTIPLC